MRRLSMRTPPLAASQHRARSMSMECKITKQQFTLDRPDHWHDPEPNNQRNEDEPSMIQKAIHELAARGLVYVPDNAGGQNEHGAIT